MAIKPFRISDSTVAVSLYDPAADSDALLAMPKAERESLMEKVAKQPSLFRDLYPKRDGQEWTVFEIGVIPVEVLARINDECPAVDNNLTEECRLRSFFAGVRSIKPWQEKIPTKMVSGVEYVDPEWLRNSFVRGLRRIALDVGAIIWRWNHMMEDEAKN